MNILPKKRWHVRTKDNIARVRRDEAEAREEERKREDKLKLAESEARINFLRKQLHSSESLACEANVIQDKQSQPAATEHFDLFADYKSHIKSTNKELEKEKKEEQEKYEKQIGYLTYLGQDTNEALKLRSWYEVAPKRAKVGDDPAVNEKDLKVKHAQDPLTLINALIPSPKSVSSSKHTRETAPVTASVPTKQSPSTVADNSPIIKKGKKDKKHKKHKRTKKNKRNEKKKLKKHKKQEVELEKKLQQRETLDRLRKERLVREAAERARQDALLAPKTTEVQQPDPKAPVTPRIVQKYNSQFNPELAKQNMM